MKRALITGITGQDGSYLAELLLGKDYEVHGIIRRCSNTNTQRLCHLFDGATGEKTRLALHYGDLADAGSLRRIVDKVRPDEVYNLAAQSHVQTSYEQPIYTTDVTAVGTVRLLDSVHHHVQTHGRQVRIFQAGSSEMFGTSAPPQNERTRFHPCSPYAAAKLAAHWSCVTYRDAYGLFICNGILFNHESPRRSEAFVTRKISRAVARIKCGLQQQLIVGRFDTKRDWGFAGDYVKAMWMMLQQDVASDYVIATGVSHSVCDVLAEAFTAAGLDWREHVKQHGDYLRPLEPESLRGDSSKAHRAFGWTPKIDFRALVRMMVEHDLQLARREADSRSEQEPFIPGGFISDGA